MLDKFIEQVLLKDMGKALDSIGPEMFLELVQEAYLRAKQDTEESDPALSELHGIHADAIEIVMHGLEGIDSDVNEVIGEEVA